jgi:mono/diheme cytochrome c family protein
MSSTKRILSGRPLSLFLLGAISVCALGCVIGFFSIKLGLLPVQADVVPSRLESHLLGAALRASVARRAPKQDNPMPVTEENLIAGAGIYRQLCARCHGASNGSANPYGGSFYPPAPHLYAERKSYSDGEMFWLVKHGIRNTAMPAWGNLLSDNDIWQVVNVVRKFDDLPEPAAAELIGRRH